MEIGCIPTIPRLPFSEAENVCRQIYDEAVRKFGPFWHLCTPGEFQQVIFVTKEDYECGMILFAICAFDCPNVKIITFELMANHIHAVLCGKEKDCEAFFALFKKRLERYLRQKRTGISLSKFEAKLLPVSNLESVRSHIVYVNRNNFVIDPTQTPWTYPYGANAFYFLDIQKKHSDGTFGDLTARARKAVTHTHDCAYPGNSLMIGNYISPVSFCDIVLGESMFRDARHYFHKLSKEVEGYNGIARAIGDSVCYTYEELYSAIFAVCMKRYDGQKPNLLNVENKMEMARIMHYDYSASNKTISKILNLDINILDEMFPGRRR